MHIALVVGLLYMATGRAAAGVAGSCRDRLGGYRWYLLNDNVMGGQSTSQVYPFEVDGISFSGVINTDGGGFVSTRTDASSKIISIPDSATMIKVEVRGDGQLYKILLSDGSRGGPGSLSPTFQHDFETTPGKWQTVTLKFANFQPSFGGRPRSRPVAPNTAQLRTQDMRMAGFMLSLRTASGKPNPKFGDGPFRLDVRSMRFV